MNIILFGPSGMAGQGVLRECPLDPDVDRVLGLSAARDDDRTDRARDAPRRQMGRAEVAVTVKCEAFRRASAARLKLQTIRSCAASADLRAPTRESRPEARGRV
jgi:hypothetical protein